MRATRRFLTAAVAGVSTLVFTALPAPPSFAAVNWSQKQMLTASNTASSPGFGAEVAFSGTTIVVGSPNADVGTTTNAGAAYVYTQSQNQNNRWVQVAQLTPSDGVTLDGFGNAVAVSGNIAVVGAPNKNFLQGEVYIYSKNRTGTWVEVAALTDPAATNGDFFGTSVAVSGNTVVVGAEGAAYVFTRDISGHWNQVATLTDGATNDSFGVAVALAGNTAVVGAPGTNGQGAAYVFTRSSSGSWSQAAELTATDGAPGDGLGVSVALSGSQVLLGAPGAYSYQGAAYVFSPDRSGNWTQAAELTASNGVPIDQFGIGVALAGTTAVIGANLATVGLNSYQGAAYVFSQNRSGSWTQVTELTSSNGAAGDDFGYAVALAGTTAVIGANYATLTTPRQGVVYLFTGVNQNSQGNN